MTKPYDPIRYHDIETEKKLYEINTARAHMGFKSLKFQIKECLTCNRKFKSIGPQHRMCRDCRHRHKD